MLSPCDRHPNCISVMVTLATHTSTGSQDGSIPQELTEQENSTNRRAWKPPCSPTHCHLREASITTPLCPLLCGTRASLADRSRVAPLQEGWV